MVRGLTAAGPGAEEGTLHLLRALLLALLTGLAIFLCWKLAAPFLNGLTWGFGLAVACGPPRRWLFARMPRWAATVLIVVLAILAIVAPLAFVLRELFRESLLAQDLLKGSLNPDGRLGTAWRWAAQELDLREIGQKTAAAVAGWIAPVMAHSISAVSQAGTAVLAFFFFVRDEETILAAIAGLMPLSRAETGRLLARVAEAVRTAIYGRVLVGLAQGFLGGVIFAVVGLPAPVFWGAVMSFLSMLPMLGAFIVWVPAAVYLAAMGDWVRALIVTGWGVAVIHPADNLLYPMIAGQRMGMHTLVLFVAFVGGLIAFGPAGLILGPCIVAFAAALADVWRERAAGEGRAE